MSPAHRAAHAAIHRTEVQWFINDLMNEHVSCIGIVEP
jgi:hypothetical protein